MRAIIIGISSDIGREIALRLCAEGWSVAGTCRNVGPWLTADDTPCLVHLVSCDLLNDAQVTQAAQALWSQWDLLIFAAGTMEPIGPLWITPSWEDSMRVNCLVPMQFVKYLHAVRSPDASIVFISGPNLAKPSPSYAAYRVSKAAAMFAMQAINDESKDLKSFMLVPGTVNTKIHVQTLSAGNRAANFDRVQKIVLGHEQTTSHDDIYGCLKWAIEQPKPLIGGRLVMVREKRWSGNGHVCVMPKEMLSAEAVVCK